MQSRKTRTPHNDAGNKNISNQIVFSSVCHVIEWSVALISAGMPTAIPWKLSNVGRFEVKLRLDCVFSISRVNNTQDQIENGKTTTFLLATIVTIGR